ncbi:hypothetical protein EQK21_04995 [Latilactobacillus curvatus]|nr:hypothetical protein EQK21_04995 [Latilactobacillus curvatus]
MSIAIAVLSTGVIAPIFNNTNPVNADLTDDVPLVQNSSLGQGFYTPNQKVMIPNPMLRSATPSVFFSAIKQGAIDTWKKHNFLPSVTAAQAAIESGWGNSGLPAESNNLFGIKGRYNGQYVVFPTREWINGQYVIVNAEFRKYPNWSASVEDHGNFFTDNSRYHNLLGIKDYKQVARLVQQDGYATDPNYASTIIRVIEQYGLQSWDQEAFNNTSVGSLDDFTFNDNHIHISGWSAANDSIGKQYSYLFAMDADTGKELKRWSINRVDRPDVQHAYPNVQGSLHSGFNQTYTVPDELKGHNVKIMVRYSSDLHGDYDTSDYYFNQVVSFPASDSRNSIDYLNQSGNNIHAIGWSIGMYTEDKPYRYAIVLDANTHQEYARVKIVSIDRTDVDKYYHNFPNATKSGFNVNIPVTDAMHGKNIFLDLRYTNDPNGNGDFVDSWATGNVLTIR